MSFYNFNQEAYQQIVRYRLVKFGVDFRDWDDVNRREALQLTIRRASCSGRVAVQFARDYSGKTAASLRITDSPLSLDI